MLPVAGAGAVDADDGGLAHPDSITVAAAPVIADNKNDFLSTKCSFW